MLAVVLVASALSLADAQQPAPLPPRTAADAQQPAPLPPRTPADAQQPPPLPPRILEPLSPRELATLTSSLAAPPPSPPYASTPAGRREEGRGILLQQKVRAFLDERMPLLRSPAADPTRTQHALSEIALLALESTVTSFGRSSWMSGVHPVAFRRACVAGAARSGRGDGSVVEALAHLVSDSHNERTRSLALEALEAIAR
jgi:hypothetical protein